MFIFNTCVSLQNSTQKNSIEKHLQATEKYSYSLFRHFKPLWLKLNTQRRGGFVKSLFVSLLILVIFGDKDY